MANLDGVRIRYQTWLPEAQRQLAGQGRLQVQMVGSTLCCKVMGDVFLRSGVEFCFHSFWLTRRSMVMLVRGTADPPDMGQPLPTGNFFHPVEWRKDAVESARAWVAQARPG